MQLALEMGRNNKHVKRWKLGGFWKQHIILAWVRLPIDKYSCRSVQVLTADVRFVESGRGPVYKAFLQYPRNATCAGLAWECSCPVTISQRLTLVLPEQFAQHFT